MPKNVRWLNGYKLIYCPEDRKAMTSANWNGYVYEHIHVAQIIMGRPLRKNEEVHHLDGNRSNNIKSNLLVLERSQHSKLHKWLKGAVGRETSHENGVNSVEPESFKANDCPVCGVALPSSRHKTCSKKCSSVYARKMPRPSREQLAEDLTHTSMANIGLKYGVSSNSIKKWISAYKEGQY